MDAELRIDERPSLRRPILIAAFKGWNDGGQGASTAVEHLVGAWDAKRFAEIDPEGFVDFQSARPTVVLEDGVSRRIEWPENVWMGVSVENADYLWRIDELRRTRAALRFLSIEPLLGPLEELDLRGIDWVIVGGESGPHCRSVDPAWVVGVRDRCLASRVPFFFKQWGGTNKKKTGRELEGRTWDELPE